MVMENAKIPSSIETQMSVQVCAHGYNAKNPSTQPLKSDRRNALSLTHTLS